MYAVKVPSYTKGYKLNGHLFQVYHIVEEEFYPNGSIYNITSDHYIDYEKKQKIVTHNEAFRVSQPKNPNIDKLRIGSWVGVSPVVYFDNLQDALAFKALANIKAKQAIFDKLDNIKKSVNKQTEKIDIANKEIIEKYPEYFL